MTNQINGYAGNQLRIQLEKEEIKTSYLTV
jgi:hypothetical protein